MSALLASSLETWTPLVALLWLASIVLLAVTMRRYATSRSFVDARAARLFGQEPFLPTAAAAEPAPEGFAENTIDQSNTAPCPAPFPAPSVSDAVRERVARDRTSARGLIELVRALYLDGSSFEFQTIAELDADDRALAKSLIEAWLADPSALDDWKSLYDAVAEVSTPHLPPLRQSH